MELKPDYLKTPNYKVVVAHEDEWAWRRRLDHRLDNIERLLLHLRDAVEKNAE